MGTCVVNDLGKSRFYDVIQEVKYLQFNTKEMVTVKMQQNHGPR